MFRMTAAALGLTFCCVMSAVPVAAADLEGVTIGEASTVAATPTGGGVDWSLRPIQFGGASRGSALPALYVSLAALQVVDGYTTTTGITRGAREANPLMPAVAGNTAAVWAVKGGVTLLSIYTAERLWKNHKRGQAIAMMLVSNGMMAAVAARNASVLRAQR